MLVIQGKRASTEKFQEVLLQDRYPWGETTAAVKELDFETAAILRDEIAMLREQLVK